MNALQSKLYVLLEPSAWRGEGMSPLNKGILALVVFSILLVVFESEASVRTSAPWAFKLINATITLAFSVELAARLWVMGRDSAYAGIVGRLRYLARPTSFVDLVATVALWVDLISPIPGSYGILLRLVRVLRVISVTRDSAWSRAIRLLGRAVAQRSRELVLSFGIAIVALLVSSTLLFAIEGRIQPEQFGSIPRAMWWAVATLTTVGYGDVYPITAMGRIVASLSALTAIAIVGMPAGIMAATFTSAFQGFKSQK